MFVMKFSEIDLMERDGHLYHFSTMKKNWDDAEEFCQQHGGHLASIHSKQENEFIKSESKKRLVSEMGTIKCFSCAFRGLLPLHFADRSELVINTNYEVSLTHSLIFNLMVSLTHMLVPI